MKKLLFKICLYIGILCVLSGCGIQGRARTGFQEKNKLSIVTTIYPIYDFTCHIVGDKAEVINLVPVGVEPHDFELSTGDMQLIEEADMFLYNGAGMEHFVDKTLSATSNRHLFVVECSDNVTVMESEHSHENGEHSHGQTDPHTWLSIPNAIVEVERIKDELVTIDPENATYYKENFENYKAELLELHALYQEELSDLSTNTIVVSHAAFGYLCREYGLEQNAIEGLNADSEPDSARMKEIIDYCKKNQIRYIFFEELVNPKVAQTIANEVGAQTLVLNPIEGLTDQQEEEGLDYIGLMKQNLNNLKTALK